MFSPFSVQINRIKLYARSEIITCYLCCESMHTRHVKTTFNKIVDIDGQLESLQPVVQRVVVSHLENETQRNIAPE